MHTTKSLGVKRNITDQIIDVLGRRIVSGEIDPQTTLIVEQDLITEFGASRNVIREAIKTLAGKNLLVSVRKKGTTVCAVEDWNLLDDAVISWMIDSPSTNEMLIDALSELRQIIEPEAAALAAKKANSTQILKLFECYEQMVANSHDSECSVHWDAEFHRVLLSATGNPILAFLANGIDRLLRSNFKLFMEERGGFIRNLKDHLLIAEAIRDSDAELARKRTKTLLAKNVRDIKKLKALQAKIANETNAGDRNDA